MTQRRIGLIRARKLCGHTQESLARALGVEPTTIRNWESGRREPQPAFRPGLAVALGLSLADLDQALTPPETDGVVSERAGEENLQLQAALSATGSGHRVDTSMAASLHDRVRALCDQYDHAPSALLISEAANLHGRLVNLPTQTTDDRARRRLHHAAAEVSILMGQVLWDASARRDQSGPLGYFTSAVHHAEAAAEPDTLALGRIRAGMVTLYGQHRPDRAATQFDQASRDCQAPIAAFALLHAAESFAFANQRAACEAALESAETLAGHVDPADPHAELCSPRTFARMAGSCMLQLDALPDAIRLLNGAWVQRKKSNAIVLSNLAAAHTRQGDLDSAAAHLHLAIDELERTRSGGGMKAAATAARQLRLRGFPRDGEVHDRLISLMAS
ncbi:helix-turn-helix transcriptional regulator [Glycomyces sp. NPDC046736]|uniref:helix-turn-helix transcriptional regulator n=1 Tax=Glycomyces sp. NPDC046736 TaxID=3155615 RepID=UPI00340600EF